MGFVQLFSDVPQPALMARHLLDRELRDWRMAARRYLLHLVLSRAAARHHGTTQDIERFDNKIKEHLVCEQIPERWRLDDLFSEAWYAEYGPGIFPCWAISLIHLCTLECYWYQILRDRSKDPYRLPGFHSDEPLWSSDWLEDFRRVWTTELKHVYPELGRYLF